MTVIARYTDRATAEYARLIIRGCGAPVKTVVRFGEYVLKVRNSDAPVVLAELSAEGLV